MMAANSLIYLLCLTLCASVCGAGKTFSFATSREVGDSNVVNHLSHLRKRQSASVASSLGNSLYWFGEFSVGDSGPLKLLIDTGSSDLLVDPGLYVN